MKDVVGSQDWRNLGHGVVAVALVAPPGVGDEGRFCIAREDDAGRRVFLLTEFNRVSGHHLKEHGRYTVANIKNTTLVREDVHEVGVARGDEHSRSVALSKRAFAEAVNERDEPFEVVSFEGFRPTFEALLDAVQEATSGLSTDGP